MRDETARPAEAQMGRGDFERKATEVFNFSQEGTKGGQLTIKNAKLKMENPKAQSEHR